VTAVDNSDLSRLAADVGRLPGEARPFLRQAAGITARKIQRSWRDEASGIPHAPYFPASITHEVRSSNSPIAPIEAEIGPDKNLPQGALGNLIEYGSVNNPAQGLGHGALQRNEGDFERGIDRAVADALKAVGL
jgi:hypothetical protein